MSGDRVTARQVLAKLDPKDLQTDVDSAQAQVVAEQARVKQTAAAFVRQEKLLPKGYTSRSEYDSAQAALRSSQSALAAAQAQLANAREQLGYTALIADAPGVITARQAEVGQVVQSHRADFQPGHAMASATPCSTSMNPCWWSRHPTRRSPSACWTTPSIKAAGQSPRSHARRGGQHRHRAGEDRAASLPKGMQLGSVVSATANGPAKPSVELPWSALTKDLSEPAVWLVDGDGKAQLHKVTGGAVPHRQGHHQ